MLNCIDNSGASLVECVMIVGRKRHASIGTPIYTLLVPSTHTHPPRTHTTSFPYQQRHTSQS